MSQSFIINLASGPLVCEYGMLWARKEILIISVVYGSVVD